MKSMVSTHALEGNQIDSESNGSLTVRMVSSSCFAYACIVDESKLPGASCGNTWRLW